jgi:hypothetical protein
MQALQQDVTVLNQQSAEMLVALSTKKISEVLN